MRLLETKTLLKYVKIYRILAKYSFINATVYRTSFIIQLFIEFGYSILFVILFNVIFTKVNTIGGWTYHQVLLLTGFHIISSEFYVGLVYIFNIQQLPEKIKNGEIDFVLTKPINSMFHLTLANPYFASFIAVIPGVYLVLYSLYKLNYTPTVTQIIQMIVVFLSGQIIFYSIGVISACISFKFINAVKVLNLGADTVMKFKKYPHTMYTGFIRFIFFIILPVVFVASVPAYALMGKASALLVGAAVIIAILFLYMAIFTWNKSIRSYASASS